MFSPHCAKYAVLSEPGDELIFDPDTLVQSQSATIVNIMDCASGLRRHSARRASRSRSTSASAMRSSRRRNMPSIRPCSTIPRRVFVPIHRKPSSRRNYTRWSCWANATVATKTSTISTCSPAVPIRRRASRARDQLRPSSDASTSIDAALPAALTPRFFADDARAQQWRAYVTRNSLPGAPTDFDSVGELIRNSSDLLDRMAGNALLHWRPEHVEQQSKVKSTASGSCRERAVATTLRNADQRIEDIESASASADSNRIRPTKIPASNGSGRFRHIGRRSGFNQRP